MRTPSARYEEARKLISCLYNVSVTTCHYNGRHDIVKCPSTGECRVCNLPLSYIVRFRERQRTKTATYLHDDSPTDLAGRHQGWEPHVE